MAKSKAKSAIQQCSFSFLQKRSLIGRFDGGDISGFGGAVILRQLEQIFGLIAGAAKCIKDTRDQAKVKHTIFNIIAQRIFLICLGYPDAVDSNFFRKDNIIRMLLGLLPGDETCGPTESTVSRLESGKKKSAQKIAQEQLDAKSQEKKNAIKLKEHGVSERDLKRLFIYFVRRYITQHKKAPETVILDFDGSAMKACGQQQYINFNAHYGITMYFPLFVFDQNGWLLAPILRPGSQNETTIALSVLKLLIKRLRKAWPKTTFIFRGDAGFHSPELFDWCEDNFVEYVCGLKGDNNLNSGSKNADKESQVTFERTFGSAQFISNGGGLKRFRELKKAQTLPKPQRKQKLTEINSREIRIYTQFWHKAGSATNPGWRQERRVIARTIYNDSGLKRRYIVTSLTTHHPKHVYQQLYARRGRMEQMIRSMKEIGSGRMSCEEFIPNQFRLILFGLSYNLFQLLRNFLPEPFQKLKEITLIDQLLRIPVQVKVATRQIWLRWSSSFPHQKLFLSTCSRLNALIEAT